MKKSKIKYEEDVYPATMVTDRANIWVFAQWKTFTKKHWQRPPDMPVVVMSWWHNGEMLCMTHQSLQ